MLERDGAPLDVTQAAERTLTGVRGRDIGMIFQEPMTSLNPVHTIGAQIEEAFRLNRGLSGREANAAARQALERVRSDLSPIPEIERFLEFVSSSQRGVPA